MNENIRKTKINKNTLYKVVIINEAKNLVPKQNLRLKIKVKNETGILTIGSLTPIHKNILPRVDKIKANKHEPNP